MYVRYVMRVRVRVIIVATNTQQYVPPLLLSAYIWLLKKIQMVFNVARETQQYVPFASL